MSKRNCNFTANISRLGCDRSEGRGPANTVKTDRGQSVYTISRDVTASGEAQEDVSQQAKLADYDSGKVKKNRYSCHSELKEGVGEIDRVLGDNATRTNFFSKGLCVEKADVKVTNVVDHIHSFTSAEGVIVKVYDECKQGLCSCDYKLHGENLQLNPCRFAYLVSLGTAECKKAYESLVSDITDEFKIVDDNMDLSSMHYECENYKSVYDPVNKAKLDSINGKKLSEDYLKIVQEKTICLHSIGAVPKPDGGIRPITYCSMLREFSVNNYCSDIIEAFQYKSVDHVLAMLQEGDYMAVVDIKSAYRAVPIFPDHRRYLGLKWEINGETVFIEDSRLCFGLRLGPSYFDKISGFVYNNIVHKTLYFTYHIIHICQNNLFWQICIIFRQ